MSKKKKFKNVWDLSVDEQMKSTDDIFSLGKVKNAPLDENGLTSDLAAKIFCDITGNKYVEPKDEKSTMKQDIKQYDSSLNAVTIDPWNEIQSTNDDTDSLKFNFIKELDRVIVDDHISPTTLSLKYINLTEINFCEDDYDVDEIGSIINDMYFYIITCKHPFAVIDNKRFENDIKKFKSINTDRFIIVSVDYYYLLYLIDEESKNKFLDIPEIYNMDDKRMLQFMITMCYNAGATQNIFFNDDIDYIRSYKEYCDRLDRYQLYMHLIETDKNTVMNDEDDEINIPIIDAAYLQRNVRETLMTLTDEDDYDDEDDDELVESDINTVVNNVSNTTVVQNNLNVNTEDFSNLLDDVAEEKIDTTTIIDDKSDNSSFNAGVIPVIKKH